MPIKPNGTGTEVLVPAPTKSEKAQRDRVGLRAMCQESVHHFTMLRRREIYDEYLEKHGYPMTSEQLDKVQPLVEEYDPVVELAIISIDRRNDPQLRRQASADAASYLRPKLSAVAMLEDPNFLSAQAQKAELTQKLVGLFDILSSAKSGRGAAEPVPVDK